MDLQKAISQAAAGSTVVVPAGNHRVQLLIDRPLTLQGEPGAVLEGEGRHGLIEVRGDIAVTLQGLTFRGGMAEAGGAIRATCRSLQVIDCTFERNGAPMYGGGAVFADVEKAEFIRCRFFGNTGRQGAALLLDGASDATVRDSLFAENAGVQGGAVKLREGAHLRLLGCTLADNKALGDHARGSALHAGSTTTRAPRFEVINCVIAGRTGDAMPLIAIEGPTPSAVVLRNSLLGTALPHFEGLDLLSVAVGDPRFLRQGETPFRLGPGSPAVGKADLLQYRPQDTDLAGLLRHGSGLLALGCHAE